MEDMRGASEKLESERMVKELEELHTRYDRNQLELKEYKEDKERFEIEARKYRNQLDHARSSLDHSYENESRWKRS